MFLMVIIAIVALTQILGMTMSADEAVAPQPPPSLNLQISGDILQFSAADIDGSDQMSTEIIGIYVDQLAENFLRNTVLVLSKSGVYLLIFCGSLWKLLTNLREGVLNDPLKLDVRNLLLIAVFAQILMLSFAAWNNLPLMMNGGHTVNGGFLARAITVLAPWG